MIFIRLSPFLFMKFFNKCIQYEFDIFFGIKDKKYRTFLLKEIKKNAPDLFFSNGFNQWAHSISFRFFPDFYFYFVKLNILIRKRFHH